MKKATLSALALTLSVSLPAAANDFDNAYQSISDSQLREHIKTLASDEFEGRLPATKGGKMTIEYLVNEFKKLGLKPGNGDSYLQPVPLVSIEAESDMTMTIAGEKLAYKKDMMAGTSRVSKMEKLENSELVFVGFGVNAPEYNWNDYEGLDVKGKTVVILVNDPGFENPESGKFNGTTMTYYGRWTYKYEEASRQGAAGALIVHETAPASYPWSVVANSWSGPQYGLQTPNDNMDNVAVQGWLQREVADRLFKKAGFDFEKLKKKALQNPTQQALGINASVTVNSTIKKSDSYNVIATLPGTDKPDEHIIYTAHWDHLGMDKSKEGDNIYNGAHDNATGTGGMIEVAEAFTKLKTKPKRSMTFLAVTAEEQGLLGSKHYGVNPVIPVTQTVANINMDSLSIFGRTKDVTVVGKGKSEMENYLAKAAKKQDRVVVEEGTPQAGYYYRSDHFNFAKVGIPALYAGGGNTPINEETAKYRKRTKFESRACYHQVCDHYKDKWDLTGAIEDLQLMFNVGYDVSNAEAWPKWAKTSEFQRKK